MQENEQGGSLFTPAAWIAKYAGLGCAYAVTGLILLPIIAVEALIKFLQVQLFHSEPIATDKPVYVYDLPNILANAETLPNLDDHSYPVAHLSFFSRQTFGRVAEITGNAVGLGIAFAAYLSVALIELSLAIGIVALGLGIAIIAGVITSIIALGRYAIVGPQQFCQETANFLSHRI